jgi:hypothetical protein
LVVDKEQRALGTVPYDDVFALHLELNAKAGDYEATTPLLALAYAQGTTSRL